MGFLDFKLPDTLGEVPGPGNASYVIWWGKSVESERFVHLSVTGVAFKVRDYIGGELRQHLGATPQPEDGFRLMEQLPSLDNVWKSARVRYPAKGPLRKSTTDFLWWKDTLTKMTQLVPLK